MSKRILFIDELRGFAAFTVMLAHLTIGFNGLKGFLYNPTTNENFYPSWFLDLLYIDGALGVAIFFLISGFIIPFSLASKNPIEFLYARIIRIYPVYIVSALVSLSLTILFGLYQNNLQILMSFLSSITLFRDWIGGSAIDGVVWTLEIEVKFYLYVALMFFAIKKYPTLFIIPPIFITIVSILIYNVNIYYPINGIMVGGGFMDIINVLLYDFGYLTFMNIGVLIYFIHVNKVSIYYGLFLILISYITSLVFLYERYTGNLGVLGLYSLALTIFIYLYKYSIDFKGFFSYFFAKISYPLYAVHSSLGFVLLSVFMFKFNVHSILSLIIVIVIVTFIAWLIHKYIEIPSLNKIKQLNNKGKYA